ncbi:MAG: hypothetical protein AAFU55_11700 [Pseudomonadota bacterium]
MNCDAIRRGGAPIGRLENLPTLEIAAVLHLRIWGKEREEDAAIELMTAEPWRAFEGLTYVLQNYWRRPLVRHSPNCPCLGADEAAFAHFVSASGDGEREDAMLLASLIVRPAGNLIAVNAAETFCLSLKRAVAIGERRAPHIQHNASAQVH